MLKEILKQNMLIRRNYIMFVKDGALLLKANSSFVCQSLRCSNCMQHGHLKKYCYVRKNVSSGMKAEWI